MNVPNAITIVRMLLVPFLVWLLLRGAFDAAAWVFFAAGVSDALDGYIARRFGLSTRLGAFLDPLADKLLVVASVLVLAHLRFLPWWLVLTIVARDIVISAGAGACYLRDGRLEMAPSLPSKTNTVVQVCLIYLVLAQAAGFIRPIPWLPALFALAFMSAAISGAHYVMVWGRRGREREHPF